MEFFFFKKYHFICHVFFFTFGPCNTVTILRNGSMQIKTIYPKENRKFFITFLHILHCCNLPNTAIVSSIFKLFENSVRWLSISFSSIDCFRLNPKNNSKKNNSVNFIWHLNQQTFIHRNILNILGLTSIQINRNVYLSKVAKLHNTTSLVILCTNAIFICNDLLSNYHIILYIL